MVKKVESWEYHNFPRSSRKHQCSDGKVYTGSGYFAIVHELMLKFSEVDVKDINSFSPFLTEHKGHIAYLFKSLIELDLHKNDQIYSD